MNETSIQQAIEQFKQTIYSYIQHPSLQTYTGTPVLNENQLFYLLIPFFNDEQWTEEHHESAVTAAIVSTALYEHEKITQQGGISIKQQVIVLAGDFYSGRYYEVLAHRGNFNMVRALSEAIVRRCEQQIQVYECQPTTIDEWLHTMMTVESEHITQFYTNYQFTHYRELAQKSLLYLRLQSELAANKTGEASLILTRMFEMEGDVNVVLQQKLRALAADIQQLIVQSTMSDVLKQQATARIQLSNVALTPVMKEV
ncbi:heptaprenyl diphosphate synthase component 1 [Caryophanon tenue]|uniref:Heptaprenyl diphosphate synthase n=1 Tax=Caryophanon tenue TaxID=33978 RepID=A0A1C0Y529_9BACL|nr:heptaprenyl diphosphate synthase component 1 [Caryophanon tenue]OCS82251.1 hypothetical protein A6M13_07390 [Caryophanon tenue]